MEVNKSIAAQWLVGIALAVFLLWGWLHTDGRLKAAQRALGDAQGRLAVYAAAEAGKSRVVVVNKAVTKEHAKQVGEIKRVSAETKAKVETALAAQPEWGAVLVPNDVLKAMGEAK